MFSLIIPVYRNEGSIPELLDTLGRLDARLDHDLEVVFVVDGSPDQSYALLEAGLKELAVRAQLLALSRNFGSFPGSAMDRPAGVVDFTRSAKSRLTSRSSRLW